MAANFCSKCGNTLENGICSICDAQTVNTTEAEPQKQVYSQADKEGMFISEDEKVLFQMGKGYAQMFLAGGGITSNAAAITNKRVYYKGKTLETLGHCKTTQVVDLKEITSVGIFRVFNVALLVLGIILMFTSIAIFASLGDQSNATAVVIGTFAVGLILMLTAFIGARRVLRIEYAGGSIAVDMRSFSKKDCENFRIALFRAKDNITNYTL